MTAERPSINAVEIDLDATLTAAPYEHSAAIPPPTREGKILVASFRSRGQAIIVRTGRVSESQSDAERAETVRQVEAWLREHGLWVDGATRVWPWPKPHVRAVIDDRAVTWRGFTSPELFDQVMSADRHARRAPRLLIISPLSDRYNGIGNYGSVALGVWRLKFACQANGIETDVWDCNIGPEIPACDTPEKLVEAFLFALTVGRDLRTYDWIGFSILNDTLILSLGLANRIHRDWPSIRLVAGNAEATLNYQDVLDKAPFECVLVGEADKALPRLVWGEDPRRIDGCIVFHRGRRMTSEEFAAHYVPMRFGDVPYHAYWKKTASLHGLEAVVSRYLETSTPDQGGEIDMALAPADMTRAQVVRKLLSICTVRIVTMDHCFLPCTYCLPGDAELDTGGGTRMPIRDAVEDRSYPMVRQHDGSMGRVTRNFWRDYDGDLVVLRVLGVAKKIRLTPDHKVRLATGRSIPAKDLVVGDQLSVWFEEAQAMLPTPLMEISWEQYVGQVYNVEVVPNHTYLADGLAVDNCSTARIPDFATGKFQRSTFLPIKSVADLCLKVKREVPGVMTIYDDSDESFLGTERGLEYADALMQIKPEMDRGCIYGRFTYLVQTRSNEMTQELVQKLAAAGVRHLTFGVENASAHVRDSLRKRQDDRKLMDLVDWCREAGLTCYYLMILFPPETRVEDLEINTRIVPEWIRRGAVVSCEPYLMPYKGTPILESPDYAYEHVTYDVPFTGPPKKRLKWPTLVWPKDPAVRGILIRYRETIDDAIRTAKAKAGHDHSFKGFTGRVCIEHLAWCLDEFRAGQIAPWGGGSVGDGEGEVHAVYQDTDGQVSGTEIRDRARNEITAGVKGSMQAPNGRFNPSHSQLDVAALKQGALKSRAQKDPAEPGERILGGG